MDRSWLKQSNLLVPRSITPSKPLQEHSPSPSGSSRSKLSSIISLYGKNEGHSGVYGLDSGAQYTREIREREIFQQNYNLIEKLKNISDSKHKDSVLEKMRPSHQFVKSYCKYIRHVIGKNPSIPHNMSFEDGKGRYLEKMRGNNSSKIAGSPITIKKTVILPDISPAGTITTCQVDGNSEKISLHGNHVGNFSRYVKSEQKIERSERSNTPLKPVEPREARDKSVGNKGNSSRRTNSISNNYFEQKQHIFLCKNHRIRGKMFYIELAQQKEKQKALFIFGRDLKTTNLSMIKLENKTAERLLSAINYDYNQMINNLDFKNSGLILRLEDPGSTRNNLDISKGEILTSVLEEKRSEDAEYREDFESLTDFTRDRKKSCGEVQQRDEL